MRTLSAMFDCHRKSLLFLKVFTRNSPIPLLRVLSQRTLFSLGHNYSTSIGTSEKDSFRINYLVNTCGLSPETASRVLISHRVSFINSENPDAVVKLLRSLNLSDSKIRDIITRRPSILSATTIAHKLEFFRSKGASNSLLAQIMVLDPSVFTNSLENRIIPNYNLINSFLCSDEWTMKSIRRFSRSICDKYIQQKVKVLQDYGVPDSNIAQLLRLRPRMLSCTVDDLKKELNKLKDLGFHPSKTTFIEALTARVLAKESTWERKVKLYEKWGWSDETLSKAFIRRPFCMLASDRKIEAVMEFFVNQVGWDSSVLAKYPILINYSLEKRIIPRASVLLFLQTRGVIKNKPCSTPFLLSEEKFHQKFVYPFKDQASQLLKLYEEKLNDPR